MWECTQCKFYCNITVHEKLSSLLLAHLVSWGPEALREPGSVPPLSWVPSLFQLQSLDTPWTDAHRVSARHIGQGDSLYNRAQPWPSITYPTTYRVTPSTKVNSAIQCKCKVHGWQCLIVVLWCVYWLMDVSKAQGTLFVNFKNQQAIAKINCEVPLGPGYYPYTGKVR